MTEIEGVDIKPLRRIPDERGAVFHMMRADDPNFDAFGEIYFSMIYPGAIKGWHLHKEMTLNYAVVAGSIKLVCYDDRPSSKTRGVIQEIFLGELNYSLVTIPPHVWNGFKGVGTERSIVANCATIPHSPDEIERRSPFDPDIPYDWSLKHR